MFDQLGSLSLIERLIDAVHRARGIADWPEAEATVVCKWIADYEYGGGWYNVSFSYRTGGNTCRGVYRGVPLENASKYLRRGKFTLQYNPKRPSHYYYPNERSQFWPVIAITSACLIGIAIAAVMILIMPK